MKQLHSDLMALAQVQRDLGREDICKWIMRHVAAEQKAGSRRRGEPKVKVRLAKSGRVAWILKELIEDEGHKVTGTIDDGI